MTTLEEISKMGLMELNRMLRSLWMERKPNMELIEACEERIKRLNRDSAIVESSEVKQGELFQ